MRNHFVFFLFEKNKRKARLNAIKTILKVATEGEKIKSVNQEPEKPIDMEDISLWECEDTEYDLVYQDHLDDADILAYFGDKYDFSLECSWPADVAEIVIKRGMSLDELPDKLLFNTSFVNDYIGQVALIRAKENPEHSEDDKNLDE